MSSTDAGYGQGPSTTSRRLDSACAIIHLVESVSRRVMRTVLIGAVLGAVFFGLAGIEGNGVLPLAAAGAVIGAVLGPLLMLLTARDRRDRM